LGGSKELEENWKLDIEKCLQEYGMTHQWISGNEKNLLKNEGKGVVFLVSANSLQLIENHDLIMRGASIPSIKHVQSNITKLKIDIIDNFIRKTA
jgi:hypothetical protein